MRDILKYALMAAAGYYAWNRFAPALSGDDDDATTPTPGPTPVTQVPGLAPIGPAPVTPNNPPPKPPPPAASGLRLAILTEASKQGYSALSRLSFDQWNWFAEQVINSPGPAWEDVGLSHDRGQAITIDAYLAAVAPQGLSGLRCLSGLGCGNCQGCSGVAAPGFVRRVGWD